MKNNLKEYVFDKIESGEIVDFEVMLAAFGLLPKRETQIVKDAISEEIGE